MEKGAMGRNLSPIVRQELANLDKDADSRRSAMKALKLYVRDLDSKAIPQFLAQVSETKEIGCSSGEYTISLYEILARVHGVNIVPQIDNIMSSIIKTLSSSAGSFALHQACSKVVPAIARYGIDPTTPDDKKRRIIHSLCKPLSDSLLGSHDSLSSGAALCLKALVDSDNWRFASNDVVNEVCLRVAGTLEDKPKQTNAHLGLVMALAKHNSFVIEAYARLLVLSGLRILNAGVVERNSQKRLSAIQMVNFLLRCLDPRSVYSELPLIIQEMEKCQSDQMAYVKGAAFETLQTAKKLAAEKGLKFDEVVTPTGINYGRRENSRRNLWSNGEQFPVTFSPESQTLDSFTESNSQADSPISTKQVHCNLDYDCRSVNRKLWKRENGGLDISLKDGLYSDTVSGSAISNTYYDDRPGQEELAGWGGDYADRFAGFHQGSSSNGVLRSATTSPQRSRSQIHVDNIKIYTTPRKLIHSLQDPNDSSSDFSEKQSKRFQDPSDKYERHSTPRYYQNGLSNKMHYDEGHGQLSSHVEPFRAESESVSSTDDIGAKVLQSIVPEEKTDSLSFGNGKADRKKNVFHIVFVIFSVVVAVFASLLFIDDHEERIYPVPT